VKPFTNKTFPLIFIFINPKILRMETQLPKLLDQNAQLGQRERAAGVWSFIITSSFMLINGNR
jgi:hypothetical protein